VNLSSGHISTEPLPEQALRLLLGGKGLGAYYLFNEQAPGVDPLAPDNNLIFNVGPLTGTTAPTAGRFGSTPKSPATNTYSDAYCGGYFGQTLKYAGYDALIVQGAASEPVSIVIDNDQWKFDRRASCGAQRSPPPPSACGMTSGATGNRSSSGRRVRNRRTSPASSTIRARWRAAVWAR
jgi:aldehyde:ferredoxin oxidoreductase